MKVFAFLLLFVVGLVIDLGGAPNHDRLGFRYWRGKDFLWVLVSSKNTKTLSPDMPWVQYYDIPGAKGRFAAVIAAFIGAAFTVCTSILFLA